VRRKNAANDDGGGRPHHQQQCEPSASQRQQQQPQPQQQPKPQQQPGLGRELMMMGTLEEQCFQFHDAGFVYERETPQLVGFVTEFNEKMLHDLKNRAISGIIRFNPHTEWI